MAGTAGAPTITVVVTFKNRHSLVRRALESLNQQTSPPTQVILVDDGSEVPLDAADVDRIIRFPTTRGVGAARNAGLEAATSEFITWLDDDDWLDVRYLERHRDKLGELNRAETTGTLGTRVLVSSSGARRAITGRPVGAGASWFREKTSLVENTLTAPVEAVRSIGGWDPNIRAWTGDDFFQRLVSVSGLAVAADAFYYSQEQEGRTQLTRDWESLARGLDRTMSKHAAVFEEDARLAGTYLRAASRNWLFAGNQNAARERARQAVLCDPRRAKTWTTLALALAGTRVTSVARRLRTRARGNSPTGERAEVHDG